MTPSTIRFTRSFLILLTSGCLIDAGAQPLRQATKRPLAVYDLNRSFSTNSNPNGPWRYGWKQKVDGELTLLTFPKRVALENSAATFVWQLSENESPGVGLTFRTQDGAFASPNAEQLPAILLEPGQNGAPENFAVARFTVPQGGAGAYRIECSVRHRDATTGDTEFRVLRTGRQIFDLFLRNSRAIGFTNVVALAEGATVDFVVGRGIDQEKAGSTLTVQARLFALELEPSVRPLVEEHPRERILPQGGSAVFAVSAYGTPPLTYQWLANGKEVTAQTNATLAITNLKSSDAGRYAVRVSNRLGRTLSSNALLRVYGPSENLIANGSFEQGINPGLSSPFNSPDTNVIQDWIIDSGSIDYVGPRWTAFDGERCVDLSGTTPGSIQQPISGLKVGQLYRVRFQVAVNPESPPPTTTVQVSVAGVTNRYAATEVGTKADLRWTEIALDFTATTTTTTARFQSLSRGWSGPIIDAVSCLPEP